MDLYKDLLRPLAFQLDPEFVHERAMAMLSRGLLRARSFHDPRLEQTVFGVKFPNPIGLAAGFDKNAHALDYWHQLGFGFVEAGTITHLAQPGNPKPRLFRLPEEQALINRFGFNNDGASQVATRLAAAKSSIPVGVNLGKSKVTPLEDAAKDYEASFRLLHSFGQYFVVNVSSPNTPGLRALQEKGPLLEIMQALRAVDATKPLFVKCAPDLEIAALDELIEVAHEANLTGIIATNTTISRDVVPPSATAQETGGLSGRPLREKADQFLAHVAKSCDKRMVIMGVGGIMNGEDIYRKIRLGAHLTQVYTGWIYGGPHWVPQALEELVAYMERDGFKSLDEARGTLK